MRGGVKLAVFMAAAGLRFRCRGAACVGAAGEPRRATAGRATAGMESAAYLIWVFQYMMLKVGRGGNYLSSESVPRCRPPQAFFNFIRPAWRCANQHLLVTMRSVTQTVYPTTFNIMALRRNL